MRVEIGKYPDKDEKRRVSVKIDRWDTWSLDSTLALVILPALRKFQKVNNGIPGSLLDMSYHKTTEWGSKEFKRLEAKAHRAAGKRWDQIIEKMIWSFDQIVRDEADAPPLPGLKSKANLASWNRRVDQYQRRLNEGLRLFGEYFQHLWT